MFRKLAGLLCVGLFFMVGCQGDDTVVLRSSDCTANPQTVSISKNTPVDITLTGSCTGGATPVFSIVPGSGPEHGTLSGTPPDVTYTPDTDFVGVDSFVFMIMAQGDDPPEATVTIRVGNNPPVAFDKQVETDPGQTVTIGLMGEDPDDEPLTFFITKCPANGKIENGESIDCNMLPFKIDQPFVKYTPAFGFNDGMDSFMYVANDGFDNSEEATVKITVPIGGDGGGGGGGGGGNGFPVCKPGEVTSNGCVPTPVQLIGIDPDGPDSDLTFIIDSQPFFSTLVPSVNSMVGGRLVIPDPAAFADLGEGDFGEDFFDFHVVDPDGKQSERCKITIIVKGPCVGGVPVAMPDTAEVCRGEPVTIDVLANDEANGGALSIASVSDPAHGTAEITNGGTMIKYTSDPGFTGTSDTFTYTLANCSGPACTTTVTVEVKGPVANPDIAATDETTPVTIDVLANDVSSDGPLTIVAVSDPPHGTAEIIAGGTLIRYTPDAGFTGDTFTYTVADGTVADGTACTATAEVTVLPVQEVVLEVADDTCLDENSPFANLSGNQGLVVRSDDTDVGIPGDDNLRCLLRFDLSPPNVPFMAFIAEARLELCVKSLSFGVASDGRFYDAHRVINDWNPETVSAETRFGKGDEPFAVFWDTFLGDIVPTPSATKVLNENELSSDLPLFVSWDVTDDVQGFVNTDDPNYGWLIKDRQESSPTNNVDFTKRFIARFASLEEAGLISCSEPDMTATAASAAPRLVVRFADLSKTPPTPPTVSTVVVQPSAADAELDEDSPDFARGAEETMQVRAMDQERNRRFVVRFDDLSAITSFMSANPDATLSKASLEVCATSLSAPNTLRRAYGAHRVLNSWVEAEVSALLRQGVLGSGVRWDDFLGDYARNPVDPIAYSQSVVTLKDMDASLTLGGFDINGATRTAPSGDIHTLKFRVETGPGHGPFHGAVDLLSMPDVTYTPDPGFTGTDTFTFVVGDGVVESAPATVTIKVVEVSPAPPNNLPFAHSQSVALPEKASRRITLSGFDPDMDALTFRVISEPTHGTLVTPGTPPTTFPDDGIVEYHPDLTFVGTDSFTFVVNDGTVDSAVGTVTIEVVPVSAPVLLVSKDIHTSTPMRFFSWDVTSDVLGFLDGTVPNNGWLVRDEEEDDTISAFPDAFVTTWVSKENTTATCFDRDGNPEASTEPRLVVTFTTPAP